MVSHLWRKKCKKIWTR